MVFVRFYHQRLKKAAVAELMRERERKRERRLNIGKKIERVIFVHFKYSQVIHTT